MVKSRKPQRSYLLFLDDERFPQGYLPLWTIARSVAEAQEIIAQQGYPSFVSFDHDLGADVPTGMDFARWLVEQDLDHNVLPADFDFVVHSANIVGGANIENFMINYLKHTASK